MTKDDLNETIHALANQIHGLVNPCQLNDFERVRLHIELLADVVGAIQCIHCRENAAELIDKYLPKCIEYSMAQPRKVQSSHRH